MMKHFKIPKFESEYKLWGVPIPKLPNKPTVTSAKRDRPQHGEMAITPTATPTVVDSWSTQPDVADHSTCPQQADHFSDIVFSFFSNNDQQHYILHPSEPGCGSPEPGNHYEAMSATTPPPTTIEPPPRLHKSELTFYVSAASLKDPQDSNNYELPPSRSSSVYTTRKRTLNDSKNETKYQNSASLDNLSQVCNASLKNAESKRSISSLPEYDTIDKKRNLFMLPKLSVKSSIKSEYSSYFDNERAIRLKNRLSAFYSAHKGGFKGNKKRFSKAWYGLKEWFEIERSKLDKVIHKPGAKKSTQKSSDEYPDSDFSDYEDVDVHVSLDSFGKGDDFGDESIVSGYSNASVDQSKSPDLIRADRKGGRSRSVCNSIFKLNLAKDTRVFHINDDCELRHSRSQPNVLQISEPVLVKINCENVESSEVVVNDDDDKQLAVGSVSPDRGSTKSDNPEAVPDVAAHQFKQIDQNAFIELRSNVKEGSVACKELFGILQQRAEAERQYACAVLRVGARSRRASRGPGTTALTCRGIALDMEARAQLHRQFSNRMVEEVVRPLQRLVSSRDVVRKQVESDVGRTARRLEDLRAVEARTKKLSHAAARFNERVQDSSLNKGSTTVQEAELKRKKNKAEEAAAKADVEYYMACLRAERARVEWETMVVKGSEILIELEEDRWASMRRALKRYITLASSLGPGSPSEEATSLEDNFETTLANEKQIVRSFLVQPPPSMHLPDFYCQHITLAMNKERRKQALIRIIQLIKTDTERERKSKQALEKLAQAITTTPNFGANDSQQNVSEKLYHMKSVLTYLEGARIQAAGALAVLTGRGRTPHPLSPHLKVARDRRGLQQTILTVPPWLQHEYRGVVRAPAEADEVNISPPSSPTTPAHTSRCLDRGSADGVSIQHYSDVEENIFDDPPERPPPPKYDDDETKVPVTHPPS
ncbi:nostrin [Arctopsyche grandis]|uniref:nostrin n=1 Tax=Arctopsyche grandis TaxID=121162 RepID=UPI00406D6899